MNCVSFVVLTCVTLAVSYENPNQFQTLEKHFDEYIAINPINRRFLQDDPANSQSSVKPVSNSDEEDEAVTLTTKEKPVEKSEVEEDEPVTTTVVKKEEITISTTEEDYAKFYPVLRQENISSTSSDVKLKLTFEESDQGGKKCSLFLTKDGKVKSFKCHQEKNQTKDIAGGDLTS